LDEDDGEELDLDADEVEKDIENYKQEQKKEQEGVEDDEV